MTENSNKNNQYLQFARLMVAGKKEEEAYREIIDCKGKSKAAVRSAAHRFAKNVTVINYTKELREAKDKLTVMSLEKIMVLLSRKAEEAAIKGDWKNLIKAIDMLNRMDGAYDLKRVEMEKIAWREEAEKRQQREKVPSLAETMEASRKELEKLRERAIQRKKLNAKYPPTPENTWHPGATPNPASSTDEDSEEPSTEQPRNEENG